MKNSKLVSICIQSFKFTVNKYLSNNENKNTIKTVNKNCHLTLFIKKELKYKIILSFFIKKYINLWKIPKMLNESCFL